MLEAVDAGYSAGNAWLVRGLDLQLRPGQVAALVGPNAAGKTTSLKLLAGLLRPARGHIQVGDRPIDAIKRRELARLVTYVPHTPLTDAAFTVRECVAMGRYCHRSRFQAETERDRSAIRTALASVDCAHLADRFLSGLSGGEIQRVVLARSLATEAPHLLLDEPTANLDIEHSLAILDLVKRVAAGGCAVLIALHDLNSVLRAADFVYVLRRGSVWASGPPAEVLTARAIREVFSVEAELVGEGSDATFRFAST